MSWFEADDILRAMRACRFLMMLTVILIAARCGKSGGGGNSPTGPSGTTSSGGGLPGTWTGTLSRPGGQPSISVRWELGAQNADFSNTGPMTLTNGTASLTVPGRATAAGNDSSGYSLHISLTSNSGEVAGFPNCSVRASPEGTPPRFTSPYKSISMPLQISYAGCDPFVAPQGLSNFIQESTQLTLTKQ